MKKITLIIFLLFFSLQNNAQLPNGSIAPDFTATDINGNQHTLSNYLSAGKTVILEFSGVFCGASWKYLRTEALQDFYNAYGLPGSNEIVVLFIENNNSLLPLQGISNPPAFGNWTEKTPFPMILNPGLHSLYAINYEPTIYRICPSGIINTIGQPSALSYRSLANNCFNLSGVQNHVKILDNTNGFCNSTANFKTKLKNYGSNTIISATLKLKENGIVVDTKTFNLNIPQFSNATLEFDPITINPTATYTTELENVNGVTNHNPSFSVGNLPFNIAKVPTSLNLQVKVYTYSCPNNMSWKITNSLGNTIATGVPYGTPGSLCNGPSNSIVEHNLTLPADECYNLNLMAYTGLGWKNYSGNSPVPTNSGIEFYSNGSLVYRKMNVENFGSLLEINNFLTTTGTLSLQENSSNKINIFPNPSKGTIYINSESNVSIKIIDFIGNIVYYSKGIDRNSTIDISKLAKGMYVAEIIGIDNEVTMQKIILN